jgi:protein-tyrosine-phosphatase
VTINILILCSGNYCRSPLAEGLLQKRLRQAGLDARVYSAGTTKVWEGRPANPLFMRIAHEMGAVGFKHWPHQATLSELYAADLILVMSPIHLQWLAQEHPGILDRAHLLSELVGGQFEVPDPIPNRPADAPPIEDDRPVRVVAQMIDQILEHGLETMMALATAHQARSRAVMRLLA